jgi:hypothetical protein
LRLLAKQSRAALACCVFSVNRRERHGLILDD